MSQAKMVTIGAEVDFTKGANKFFAACGKALCTGFKRGRKYDEWQFQVTSEGSKRPKGTNFWVKVPMHTMGDYCKVVGERTEESTAKVEEVQEARYQKEKKRSDAVWNCEAEPGDIVTVKIKSTGKTSDFKVIGADYKTGKLKGFDTSVTRPGSKSGWVNVAHPDVEVTMKQKGGFDPNTDPVVQAYKDNAAEAGAKRATTRRRREDLRNLYGF